MQNKYLQAEHSCARVMLEWVTWLLFVLLWPVFWLRRLCDSASGPDVLQANGMQTRRQIREERELKEEANYPPPVRPGRPLKLGLPRYVPTRALAQALQDCF